MTTGGVTAEYWYDTEGNLDCITTVTGSSSDCSPSNAAPTSGVSASLVADYSYDYLNRLSSYRFYNATSSVKDRAAYTYDALDRVTKEIEKHGSAAEKTTTFSYLGLTNLATEERQVSGTETTTKSFSYDAYGLRISMTNDPPDTNGVTDPKTFTYAYDVHGSTSLLLYQGGGARASRRRPPLPAPIRERQSGHLPGAQVGPRPDRVTYFFDEDGYPTFVKDKNGNELQFTLQNTPAGEDPGGPKKRITAVTDAGGRSFSIDYYEKAEAPKPQIRGNIQTISDHSGSKLDFDYYDDGNLLRITQRGGTNADGSYLADRSIVFTYTTSDGVSPAATNLLNPSPKTPNQSTHIYSVADPVKNKTVFSYYGPSEGAHLRWKLKSVTNRTADKTSYGYDIDLRKTTVTKPLGRVATYNYDTDGKLTSMLDPLNRQTSLTWSSDFHVTQVAEPGTPARSTSYTYNNNGYVTSFTDQEGHKTELVYQNVAADSADPLGLRDKSPYWKSGRSIPHVSQLISKTDPKGVGNADPDDYQWNFTYDSKGNLLKVIEPEPTLNPVGERYTTVNSYNPNGTLLKTTDPNGNPTSFEAYDANGFPTRIVDAESRTTQFFYDDDGLLRWIQDPRHLNDSGGDERSYRIFFDYDSFHRLGRQSAPKSTAASRGLLIWSGAQYDANDNLKVLIDPHYGRDYPGSGSQSKVDYDAMDRPTVAVSQEGHKTGFTYDDAGRLVSQTAPKGMETPAIDKDFAIFYDYDLLDRVTRQTRHAVDGAGAVTETRTTLSCYDLAGDLTAMTAPRADRTSIPCPPDGVPFTWRYEYDKAHRVVKSIDPKGNARTQHYDPNGAVDFASNENTDRSEFFYDQRGLPIKSVEPFKPDTNRTVTTMSVYDGAGNLTKSISPRAYDASADKQSFTEFVTTYHYNRVNQVVKVELPTRKDDLTTVNVNEAEQAYVHNSYDDNGNLRWTSLPTTEGNPALVSGTAKTEMTYFDPGWIKTSTDNVNPKVHFDYTAQGWQRERTPELKSDPGNLNRDRTLTWSYYPDGLLKERIDPDGQRSTYDYDPNDNLLEAVDAAGVTTAGQTPMEVEARYNGFDEETKVRNRKKSDSGSENNWSFTEYQYDKNGNVTLRLEDGEESPSGTEVTKPRRHLFSYDQADWMEFQRNFGRDSGCKDDQKVVNTYFSTGWEKQREIFRTDDTCTVEDADWKPRQKTTWDYFANGKLKTLETRSFPNPATQPAGDVKESHSVSYIDDNGIYVNGHRTEDAYVLKRPSATKCEDPANPCRAKFSYDARDRLVRHDDGHGGVTSYIFDQPAMLLGDKTIRASNLTTEEAPDGTVTRIYEGNRLSSLTAGTATAKYFYDDFANIDCITKETGSQADCSPSDKASSTSSTLVADYSYDSLNRLSSYRFYAGGPKKDSTDYSYDALDRTVKETETHDEWSGTTRTTKFSYQGLSDLVTEERITGKNPTTKTYSYDAFGHRISLTNDPDDPAKETKTYTYGYDVHGSVSQLITQGGQVQASYGYTPTGARTKS